MSAERAASMPCRGCGQRVFFVRTINGKKLPVNLEPDDAGNCAVHRDVQGVFVGRTLTKEDNHPSRGERLYMPHMATCAALKKSNPDAPLPPNVIPISRGRQVEIPR